MYSILRWIVSNCTNVADDPQTTLFNPEFRYPVLYCPER